MSLQLPASLPISCFNSMSLVLSSSLLIVPYLSRCLESTYDSCSIIKKAQLLNGWVNASFLISSWDAIGYSSGCYSKCTVFDLWERLRCIDFWTCYCDRYWSRASLSYISLVEWVCGILARPWVGQQHLRDAFILLHQCGLQMALLFTGYQVRLIEVGYHNEELSVVA